MVALKVNSREQARQRHMAAIRRLHFTFELQGQAMLCAEDAMCDTCGGALAVLNYPGGKNRANGQSVSIVLSSNSTPTPAMQLIDNFHVLLHRF